MTEHDVLVGFRLRLFTLADELGNVSAACRAMGVDRSTYYRPKKHVDRWGLEALNVRERRRPRMPIARQVAGLDELLEAVGVAVGLRLDLAERVPLLRLQRPDDFALGDEQVVHRPVRRHD